VSDLQVKTDPSPIRSGETDEHAAEPPSHHGPEPRNLRQLLVMCVSAAGVVYGDIGTSPLYTWNEIRKHGIIESSSDVIGLCSLIVWTLTLVMTFKYVILVLSADNNGEGGTFALMGLVQRLKGGFAVAVTFALTLAACLLYGEGLITPAISVLSAVEGLAVANPLFEPAVVPLALLVLFGLFKIQNQGTARVGRVFGLVMCLWFAVIALLGSVQIVRHPGVLLALLPTNAIAVIWRHGIGQFLPVLGSVVLCVTGGEALYADMGHFGARSIRVSWAAMVYPALLLNYLGQAAKLLSGDPIPGGNVFFSLVPQVALYPMVALATFAAIIASQALISGAFSLTRAAINLGLLPRVLVVHTSSEVEGQIYMPAINWMLWAGCSALVVAFQSSSGLASAYGLSVMGVMLTTTVSMAVISVRRWGWPVWRSALVFSVFGIIDVTYLAACALKLPDGGWMPLTFALCLLYLMITWRRGRESMSAAYRSVDRMSVGELLGVKTRVTSLPRAMVFLTQESVEQPTDGAPVLLMKFVDRYGGLPRHLTLLTVINEPQVPYWLGKRFDVVNFGENVVSVRMHLGYMETPDVRAALTTLKRRKLVKIHATRWTIVMGKEEILLPEGMNIFRKSSFIVYRALLTFASQAHVWFGLGSDAGLSKEVVPVRVTREGAMEVVLRRMDTAWLESAADPS
jgi:KUP system potassium uptake protein